MRTLYSLFIMLLLAACGQDGTSSSNHPLTKGVTYQAADGTFTVTYDDGSNGYGGTFSITKGAATLTGTFTTDALSGFVFENAGTYGYSCPATFTLTSFTIGTCKADVSGTDLFSGRTFTRQ